MGRARPDLSIHRKLLGRGGFSGGLRQPDLTVMALGNHIDSLGRATARRGAGSPPAWSPSPWPRVWRWPARPGRRRPIPAWRPTSSAPADGLLVRFDPGDVGRCRPRRRRGRRRRDRRVGRRHRLRPGVDRRPACRRGPGEARPARRVGRDVGPNTIRYAAAVPNDPNYATQSAYLQAMNLPDAWNTTTGNDSMIMAIVDSGVQLNHPDLAGRLVPGWDFVNNDSDPSDDFGHGTMVAGIAAASTNNGRGRGRRHLAGQDHADQGPRLPGRGRRREHRRRHQVGRRPRRQRHQPLPRRAGRGDRDPPAVRRLRHQPQRRGRRRRRQRRRQGRVRSHGAALPGRLRRRDRRRRHRRRRQPRQLLQLRQLGRRRRPRRRSANPGASPRPCGVDLRRRVGDLVLRAAGGRRGLPDAGRRSQRQPGARSATASSPAPGTSGRAGVDSVYGPGMVDATAALAAVSGAFSSASANGSGYWMLGQQGARLPLRGRRLPGQRRH